MAPKSSTNASGPRTRRATDPRIPPRFEDAAWANWGDGGKHRETKWQAVTHVCIFLHGALANPWVIWLPTFAGHGAMVLVFFQRGQWNCTKLKMLKCWKMRRHEVPAESQASLALEREPLSQDKLHHRPWQILCSPTNYWYLSLSNLSIIFLSYRLESLGPLPRNILLRTSIVVTYGHLRLYGQQRPVLALPCRIGSTRGPGAVSRFAGAWQIWRWVDLCTRLVGAPWHHGTAAGQGVRETM